MAGVRIGLLCDQLHAPTPAGRHVGVSCERRVGLPWLHGHALQSGTWQVRVLRRRHDLGDADQPELVRFPSDSDSLLLAAPSLVWNLGLLSRDWNFKAATHLAPIVSKANGGHCHE